MFHEPALGANCNWSCDGDVEFEVMLRALDLVKKMYSTYSAIIFT